jgi:hypothetical protein
LTGQSLFEWDSKVEVSNLVGRKARELRGRLTWREILVEDFTLGHLVEFTVRA